jgi:aspartate/methionine/tyrosine aminotransferase
MDSIFSDRITDVPRSFIREILKVALDPAIISFVGGLPNREYFPDEELEAATNKIFRMHGRDIFQYSNSEGYLKLREYIAERYRQKNRLDVPVENILITSGSQQGLDLLGKILLNDGDGMSCLPAADLRDIRYYPSRCPCHSCTFHVTVISTYVRGNSTGYRSGVYGIPAG